MAQQQFLGELLFERYINKTYPGFLSENYTRTEVGGACYKSHGKLGCPGDMYMFMYNSTVVDSVLTCGVCPRVAVGGWVGGGGGNKD